MRLGIANLVREPTRTGVMAVAIGAAVGVAVITTSLDHAVIHDITAEFQTPVPGHGVSVSTLAAQTGFNNDARIPSADLAALARLPGVAGIDLYDQVLAGHRAGHLVLVGASTTMPNGLVVYEGHANPRAFDAGRVMIGAGLARRDHLRPGSSVVLDTPGGFAWVPIQGIWADGNAAGNDVTMPSSLESRLYGPQLPNDVTLLAAPGVSLAAIVARARAAHLSPFVTLSIPSHELDSTLSSVSGQFSAFWVLQRALLIVAFESVLSTLVLVGIQRRREFGLLHAIGMTPRQLFSMVVSEAVAAAASLRPAWRAAKIPILEALHVE